MADPLHARRARRVRGDIFAQPGALVHQINCVSPRFAGLARHVFDRFPSTEPPRSERAPGACLTLPLVRAGCATTHVSSLCSQMYPGPSRFDIDSPVARLAMLDRALDQLALQAVVFEFAQINFPRGFGAGLARGDWRDYKARIHAFAARVACPVTIVKLPPPTPPGMNLNAGCSVGEDYSFKK